ncbi:hypothetical protein AAHE18_10G183700 [Arachis hypogaea]
MVRSADSFSSAAPPLLSFIASSASTKTTVCEFRCGSFGGGRVTPSASIKTLPWIATSSLARSVASSFLEDVDTCDDIAENLTPTRPEPDPDASYRKIEE